MRGSIRRRAAVVALLGMPVLAARRAPADPPAPPDLTILVIPGSHLDVGFTDLPSRVREKRIATLDTMIDAMEKNPDLRWTEECGWVIHEWLVAHAKDPERIAKAGAMVRAGGLGIGALYVNPHAALFEKGLSHLFAFHEEVEAAFGSRPQVAVINDVPSVPEALVDAAYDAGVETFLCGTNLAFSPPFPPDLVSGPFRWRSAEGRSVNVSVDPDSYTSAFTRWGIDPPLASLMNRARFGSLVGMAVAESGIAEMSEGRSGTVAIQQAFDNWGPEAALRLPAFASAWNSEHPAGPLLKPALPATAVKAWGRTRFPLREGEWGGTWEEVRAGCPVTTAHLRYAAAQVGKDAPLARRLALALAMDHTGGLGPGWPMMFTEEQTKAHAAEWGAIVADATGGLCDPLVESLATLASRMLDARALPEPPDAPCPPGLDALSLDPRLRLVGLSLGGPFFPGAGAAIAAPSGFMSLRDGHSGDARYLFARLDRTVIPGDGSGSVAVGWDVPLVAKASEVRAWPAGSKSAAAGKWLRGAPPPTFIAPDGLVVATPQGRLLFHSPLVFAYRVVDVGGHAHVQALLVRQSRLCTFKGGGKKALPFADLYPGEPAVLDAALEIQAVSPR